MTDSQQSFSLPSAYKERLENRAAGHATANAPREGRQALVTGPGEAAFAVPARPGTAQTEQSDGGGYEFGSVFNQPYSQSLEQTQEDTASIRRLAEQASTEQRLAVAPDEYFNESSMSDSETFAPKDASTGKMLKQPPSSGSPSSGLQGPEMPPGDSQVSVQFQDNIDLAALPTTTPFAARTKKHETPMGLTQLFQSSQDTPDLSRRKSTYISMKESQERRTLKRRASNPDEEDESDPDFPRVRRALSPDKKRKAESHVWNRLRERDGPLSMQETFQDISIIPASAPVEPRSQTTQRVSQLESVVANSQPVEMAVTSSKTADKTIDFDIKSISADVTTSEETRPLPVQEFDLVSQSPQHTTLLSTTDETIASVSIQDTPAVPRTRPTPAAATTHTRSVAETPFVRDHSSPVMQAGDRRKRRRTLEQAVPVSSSPAPAHDAVESLSQSLKDVVVQEDRRLVPDSLGQTSTETMMLIRRVPVRRLQTVQGPQVVFDSQTQSRSLSIPMPVPEPETARAPSPLQDVQEATSPLSSLDSASIMEHTSPHFDTVPGAARLTHRVFAYHAETDSWFPGSMVEAADLTADEQQVRVHFDDDDMLDLTMDVLRPLILRAGDIVHVTEPSSLQNKPLVILELLREDGALKTDIAGHARFKATRKDHVGTPHLLAIADLWLPAGKIAAPFLLRKFSRFARARLLEPPATPSKRVAAVRAARSITGGATPSQATTLHREPTGGLFDGVAFSVTLPPRKDKLRQEVCKLILDHGGIVLEEGFTELFDSAMTTEDLHMEEDGSDVMPTADDCAQTLRLAPQYASMRAACVISDAPSRKAKYLQALALDLPCFHYGYLQHCVAAFEDGADATARPFLLAAGDVTLDGESVSICMDPIFRSLTSPSTLSIPLERSLGQRRQLLRGQNCIVVVGRKREAEQRKIHLFLSCAMGCARVVAVETIADAVKLVQHSLTRRTLQVLVDKADAAAPSTAEGRRISQRVPRPTSKAVAAKIVPPTSPADADNQDELSTVTGESDEAVIWHWINVRERAPDVTQALKLLEKQGKAMGAGKKRGKRRGQTPDVLDKGSELYMPGVLTNEDVVQSLISGQITGAYAM